MCCIIMIGIGKMEGTTDVPRSKWNENKPIRVEHYMLKSGRTQLTSETASRGIHCLSSVRRSETDCVKVWTGLEVVSLRPEACRWNTSLKCQELPSQHPLPPIIRSCFTNIEFKFVDTMIKMLPEVLSAPQILRKLLAFICKPKIHCCIHISHLEPIFV
jgi:hypothetical protein